jgi:hypothetical protein
VIIVFAELLAIILRNPSELEQNYKGIGPVSYFALALRNSIGDFDFESMVSGDTLNDFIWLQWFVWIIVIFIGNVVFMNFIIAVVSDSYERCINKMDTQTMLEKIDLIIERERMITDRELRKYHKEWFPRYLYVCRPAQSENNKSKLDTEWQGIVKEVKKIITKTNPTR